MRRLVTITLAAVGLFWLAVALYLPRLESEISQSEAKYRHIFSSVRGVVRVSNFVDYEGHRSVSLVLAHDRYLHLVDFDESVAESTRRVNLVQIGDIHISCNSGPQARESATGGLSIIDVSPHSSLQLQLKNVGDVIANYEKILEYVQATIPEKPAGPVSIKTPTNLYWCSRTRSGRRE